MADPPAPQTLRERWEQRGEDLDFDELPRIRSMAEKWTQTITALAGLSTIITLLQGNDEIKELADGTQLLLFGLLLLALIAAVVAIFFGTRAATGTPGKLIGDWELIRTAFRKRASAARNELRLSQIAALLATSLIVASLLTVWFGEQGEKDGAVSSLVVQRSGTVLCGELKAGSDGQLTLTPKGAAQGVVVADVASINIVDACP
jgi:hypothetical protein